MQREKRENADAGTQTQPQWSRPNDSTVSTAMDVNNCLGF